MNVSTRNIAVCLLVASAWLAAPASATIIFTLGNNPEPGEENILFGAQEGPSLTITGYSQSTNVPVIFTSTQSLCQNAKGQADIDGCGGNGPNATLLTNIDIGTPSQFDFGDFILNLQNGSGTANVDVLDNLGNHFLFSYSLGNGQNFLTIVAVAGERIDSISVDVSGQNAGFGFLDLKQPRISGLVECANGVCVPVPDQLPEPGTLGLLGLGGFAGALMRRRTKRATTN